MTSTANDVPQWKKYLAAAWVDHALEHEFQGSLRLLPSAGGLYDASGSTLHEGQVERLLRDEVEAKRPQVRRWRNGRVFLEGQRLVQLSAGGKVHHAGVLLDGDRGSEEVLVEFGEQLRLRPVSALDGEVANSDHVGLPARRLAADLLDALLAACRGLRHLKEGLQERVNDHDRELTAVHAPAILTDQLGAERPIRHSHEVVGCLDVVNPDPDFTRPPVCLLPLLHVQPQLRGPRVEADLIRRRVGAHVETQPGLVEGPRQGPVGHCEAYVAQREEAPARRGPLVAVPGRSGAAAELADVPVRSVLGQQKVKAAQKLTLRRFGRRHGAGSERSLFRDLERHVDEVRLLHTRRAIDHILAQIDVQLLH
mmetsp:Transcript_13101/g.35845  ORF Transcript_13101/g.35845 Transcript_13101/m.35845 type:complete len:367 (+) Transcript_13101:108-1208(+)